MASTDDCEIRYHQSPCGLLSTTLDGTVIETNDSFLEWTGYPREQVVGRPLVALFDAPSRLFFETRHLQVLHLQERIDEVALTIRKRDGGTLPVLLNSVLLSHGDGEVIRFAVFPASGRIEYERQLLEARRAAESSEARVRILQEASRRFEVSENDGDLGEALVVVARSAFAATHAAVLLVDEGGELQPVAGTDPLWGKVPPAPSLRSVADVTIVDATDEDPEFPEVAAQLRLSRLRSFSIAPLLHEGERLGLLVCYFSRRRDFDEPFFEVQRALGRQATETLLRVRLQQQLARLAHFDQLTGVANREFLQRSLEAAILDAQLSLRPLALIFLDVDDFKSVNDNHGHAAGDMLLRHLAAALRSGTRGRDLVGRIGGDEFVIICPNADPEAAAAVAERVRLATHAAVDLGSGPVSVSVSLGVATYDPASSEPPSPTQLLIRADAAMYRSKGEGKDRVTVSAQG